MSNQPLTVAAFNDGVAQLAPSGRDLAARFGQQRTVETQVRLIREELEEVLAATDDAHRVEELCDLIVVWHGLFDARYTHYGIVEIGRRDSQSITETVFVNKIELAIVLADRFPAIATEDALIEIWNYLSSISRSSKLFPQQVARVVAKNAAKTDATHYLDSATGKITRKAAQS